MRYLQAMEQVGRGWRPEASKQEKRHAYIIGINDGSNEQKGTCKLWTRLAKASGKSGRNARACR